MEAADNIGVIIDSSTMMLLILVIILFQSVYIVLPRNELYEKYVLRDAPATPGTEETEDEEPVLVQ
ncbi:MAG: hypothetical protein FI717_01400 [SAR202 cluster bacterium]|nr:hypothetical protein [SAR202 cluster bacterium]